MSTKDSIANFITLIAISLAIQLIHYRQPNAVSTYWWPWIFCRKNSKKAWFHKTYLRFMRYNNIKSQYHHFSYLLAYVTIILPINRSRRFIERQWVAPHRWIRDQRDNRTTFRILDMLTQTVAKEKPPKPEPWGPDFREKPGPPHFFDADIHFLSRIFCNFAPSY